MSDDFFCYYYGKTTHDEYLEIRESLKEFDDFVVEYNEDGNTVIRNDEPVGDFEGIENKLTSLLQDKNSTVVFSYIIESSDSDPYYGLLSKNGDENFDIQLCLQKMAENKRSELEHQKNTSQMLM